MVVRPNDSPWFNDYLRRLRRKKDRNFNKFKLNKNCRTWTKFKESRNLYINECHKAKETYNENKYKQLILEAKNNPKNGGH